MPSFPLFLQLSFAQPPPSATADEPVDDRAAVPSPAIESAPVVAPAPERSTEPVPEAALRTPPASADPPARAPSPYLPRGEAERMKERTVGKSGNVTYKPGAGFSVETDDGKWSIGVLSMIQLLYTSTHLDPPGPGQLADSGTFQLRRARLFVQGNAFSPHFKYSIQLQFSPRDLGLTNGLGGGTVRQSPMFWGYVIYDKLRDLNLQAGLFFTPYSRQRIEPPWRLSFGDSSLAAYEFGFDRDIGVALRSSDVGGLGGRLRYAAGVFMGDGFDFHVDRGYGMQYVARFEVLPFGSFDDYSEPDFARLLEPKLAIAGAYSFVDDDPRTKPLAVGPTDGGTTDTHDATADLAFRIAGLSILGDFFWRQGSRNAGSAMVTDGMGGTVPAPVEAPRNGMGWTGQMGYLIPRVPLEIAARYSGIRHSGTTSSIVDTDELGPALSYYFFQHALKLQLDYFHQFAAQEGDRVRLQLTAAF